MSLLMNLYAVEDRNALEEGTLTARETAGYWIYNVNISRIRKEFEYMLNEHDIDISKDQFYNEVNNILKEAGI